MDQLIIKSPVKNFRINFTDDFSFISEFLKFPYYFIVVGTVVYKHYKKSIFQKFPKKNVLVLPLGEKRKTLKTVIKIYNRLLNSSAKKNLNLISFGGGINQDVTGFAASTLYRGINWIYVPTTLLAMADSAIGLKTSLNFNDSKNVLGTFYPPTEIYINVNFLKTLKKSDYLSGVGEIIKFMLMKKNALKHLDDSINKIKKLKLGQDKRLALKIIKESIEIKKSYMEGDVFDTGKRNLLNYGHELGHALEATSNFRISHGNGVIIGIIFANLVSTQKGWLDEKINEKINNELLLPSIKELKIKRNYFNYEKLLSKMKKDKKRISDKLPLVLPDKNFELIKITDFNFQELKKTVQKLMEIVI